MSVNSTPVIGIFLFSFSSPYPRTFFIVFKEKERKGRRKGEKEGGKEGERKGVGGGGGERERCEMNLQPGHVP